MSRERERVFRERESRKAERFNQEWTTVTKRKHPNRPYPPPPPPLASTTAYIKFLPPRFNSSDVAGIFHIYGPIIHISLPKAKRPNPQYQFAFVKFRAKQSLHQAILHENGRIIEGKRLKVELAKTDTYGPPPKSHQQTNLAQNLKPTKPKTNPNPSFKTSLRDHRSYKDASTPHQTNPTTKHNKPTYQTSPSHVYLSLQQIEPQPDFIQQEMSYARIMCSRVLGEEVEQARINLETGECDEETVGLIKLSRSHENDELLKRSLIGVSFNPTSSNSNLHQILAEGVSNITITSLGGPMHLLSFESEEDKQLMLESKWLERWYMELRNASSKISSLWRETWVTIYGIPLSAWSYDNILKIGSIFGKVLSVNQRKFEYTKILISTDCMFKINCKMAIDVDGEKSKIHIWESPQDQSWMNNAEKKPGSKVKTDTDPIDSDDEKPPSGEDEKISDRNDYQPLENGSQVMSVQFPNEINDPAIPKNNPTPQKNGSQKSQTVPKACPDKPQVSKQPNSEPGLHEGHCKSSPSQPKHYTSPSKSINQVSKSPNKSPNPQITKPNHSSPMVHLNNRFNPLQRQNTHSTTITSSSGPSFPPGFEESIPLHLKQAHARKRKKKAKRRMQKKAGPSSSDHRLREASSHHDNADEMFNISADDVIEMGHALGASFNGPRSALKERIESILSAQKANWDASQR
uniref:RRM domain-containing protein n=1 Tax=Beta vulgaris subsp. vulgaris TaxID=3555 RepID=F4NCM3_BETVV|nr:hypothetical protein [Beta vulgaris subsp. vulgaris]